MNTRRKITNVTKKDGFDNMYNIHYLVNRDIRGNNTLHTYVESIIYKDGKIEFDPKSINNMNGLQLISHRLRSTQTEVINEIRKYL